MTETVDTPHDVERASLVISGMTCASCAGRVERALNDLDGVTATVNLATERASITFDPEAASTESLVAAVEHSGYGASVAPPAFASHQHGSGQHSPSAAHGSGHVHADDDAARHLRRLTVSAALTVPLVAISMVPSLQFDYWQLVALALATPVVLWGGASFHRMAWHTTRMRSAGMDTLISMGSLIAWGYSLAAIAFLGAGDPHMRMHPSLLEPGMSDVYFEVAASIVTLILLGRYLEARAKQRAGNALHALLELGAQEATLLRDNEEVTVAAAEVQVGDRFVVRPGEKVATDGTVTDGESTVDVSMLTGEPVPLDVGVGSAVTGGTINVSGRLAVEATRVGADTALAHIAALVEQAQTGKADVQRLADRVSAVFVPTVLVLAAATLLAWLATGAALGTAVSTAVAVLIVACPCALGLAVPVALMVGTGRGAQLGILIEGPQVLESTRAIDTVVLDKTGTLTLGRMRVAQVTVDAGFDRDEALALVASAEHGSEHPIARAVVDAARSEGRALQDAIGFTNHAGRGVTAIVDGRPLLVGRAEWLSGQDIDLPPSVQEAIDAATAAGHTAVVGAWGGRGRVVIAVADTIRDNAADAVRALHAMNLRTVLLTGDNERSARTVASQVGIDDVVAGVLPDEKSTHVQRLQRDGHVVAMVGDGVNDAPALAQADLGVAMGSGTDAAMQASDITLVAGDVAKVATAIALARATLGTIKRNLFWAFAYNVAAIPLAMTGHLNPIIAAAAMAFSSLFVVLSSLLLRRFGK